VIGTPPPAEERTLLGTVQTDAPPAPAGKCRLTRRPGRAKRAERIVATLFILAMLGRDRVSSRPTSGLPVGAEDAVLRSNLALGISMAVAFLALGAGAVIWVRRLMPDVELTEAASRWPRPSRTGSVRETFREGAEASQFVNGPSCAGP